MKNTIFLSIGDRFGRLLVIDPDRVITNKRGQRIRASLVRCDCGDELEVRISSLTSGNTTSCGCRFREELTERNRKHGGSNDRLYTIHMHIKGRCENPKNPRYENYGGRGISVHPEWSQSYEAFRDWARSAGYADDLTIERKNVNDGYNPANCCFIPLAEQQSNTTRTVRISAFGETKNLADWSRDPRCPVSAGTLSQRLRQRWDHILALTIPSARLGSRKQ